MIMHACMCDSLVLFRGLKTTAAGLIVLDSILPDLLLDFGMLASCSMEISSKDGVPSNNTQKK